MVLHSASYLRRSLLFGILAVLVAISSWLIYRADEPRRQARRDSALMDAVHRDDYEMAVNLIHQGAIPQIGLIAVAVSNSNYALIDLLIRHGEHPQNGMSTACESGNVDMIQKLIDLSARPKVEDVLAIIQQGNIPAFELVLPCMYYIKPSESNRWCIFNKSDGRLDQPATIQNLVVRFAPDQVVLPMLEKMLRDRRYNMSEDAERYAAFDGNESIVEFYREHGYPYGLFEIVGLNRVTELQLYLEQHPDCLEVHQATFDVFGHRMPILYVSLVNGYHEISRQLLNAGASTDFNELGTTALLCAASKPDRTVLSQLVNLGLDVNEAHGEWQETPLLRMLIESSCDMECVQLLLNAGARVDQPLSTGFTALQCAVGRLEGASAEESRQWLNVIRLLDAKGAPQTVSLPYSSLDSYCQARTGVNSFDKLLAMEQIEATAVSRPKTLMVGSEGKEEE